LILVGLLAGGAVVAPLRLMAVLKDGVAASLFASVVGLMVSVLAGLLHGAGFADPTIAVCLGRRFLAAAW
jgi:hypothetical protein